MTAVGFNAAAKPSASGSARRTRAADGQPDLRVAHCRGFPTDEQVVQILFKLRVSFWMLFTTKLPFQRSVD